MSSPSFFFIVLATVVFVLGTITGFAGVVSCSEYNESSHTLRAEICRTVGTEESFATLAFVPPILIGLLGLSDANRRVVTMIWVVLLVFEASTLAVILVAAS